MHVSFSIRVYVMILLYLFLKPFVFILTSINTVGLDGIIFYQLKGGPSEILKIGSKIIYYKNLNNY